MGAEGGEVRSVRKFALLFALVAVAWAGAFLSAQLFRSSIVCPGDSMAMRVASGGSSPYVTLTADGRRGNFLLDWGSTTSSLSAAAFPDGAPTSRRVAFDLPSFAQGQFQSAQYPAIAGLSGEQLGLVGTDFLSQMSATLSYDAGGGHVRLSAQPCDAGRLTERGYVPVDQTGYFSARPAGERANVPVLFVALGSVTVAAQIDSGYEDRLWRHSIDINETLHRRLVEAGIRLEPAGATSVATCKGSEKRSELRVPGLPLAIQDDKGRIIRRITDYHLIPKAPNACGGIADTKEPAAQLGASFLRTLSPVVIDGKAGRVWIRE